MKKFRIIEIRCTENGDMFVVETTMKAESENALREFLDKEKPSTIKDKNYRIKEINNALGSNFNSLCSHSNEPRHCLSALYANGQKAR